MIICRKLLITSSVRYNFLIKAYQSFVNSQKKARLLNCYIENANINSNIATSDCVKFSHCSYENKRNLLK